MSKKNSRKLSDKEMYSILLEEDTGYLCMSDNNIPYAVPLSYAFIDKQIVIHTTLTGKKLDIIRKNPNVCFSLSRNQDKMRPHTAEQKCKYKFESIILQGKAVIIDDINERLKYLRAFKSYFFKKLNLDDSKNPVNIDAAKICTCFVIDIESMTGRRSPA